MANFVYALVYTVKRNFLIATKNRYGYFWGPSFQNKQGVVVQSPSGELNGAGKPAFPGGKANTGNWVDEAKREFFEETGNSICDTAPTPLGTYDVMSGSGHITYFLVDESALQGVLTDINLRLAENKRAAADVKAGIITSYTALKAKYNNMTADDELDTMAIWNLDTNTDDIKKMKGDPNTGWFFEALDNLKKNI